MVAMRPAPPRPRGVHATRRPGEDARGVTREADDFYPTPAPATLALLTQTGALGAGEVVWEPACGDGAIVSVLAAAGHEVVATDLVDRGCGVPRVDFLMESRLAAPVVVTNPPFKLAAEFSRHAMALGVEKIILLLPLSFLTGISREDLTSPYTRLPLRLASVHLFADRFAMWLGGEARGSGSSAVNYGWFVWRRVGDCPCVWPPVSRIWFDPSKRQGHGKVRDEHGA